MQLRCHRLRLEFSFVVPTEAVSFVSLSRRLLLAADSRLCNGIVVEWGLRLMMQILQTLAFSSWGELNIDSCTPARLCDFGVAQTPHSTFFGAQNSIDEIQTDNRLPTQEDGQLLLGNAWAPLDK